MNLSSKNTIQELLSRYGITPKKGLGQNFLIAQHVISKLIAAANIISSDTVLEIGPGIGSLTAELAHKAKAVIAIEKDQKMVEILQETLADFQNIEIIQGDALKKDLPKLPYKLVANLPYYIAAPTIRRILEAKQNPQSLTLLIQKEVAQRICAKPPRMNIFAVSVQFYATPKLISSVKKTSFWPQPKVDSSILHIIPHKEYSQIDSQEFFKVMKAGFKQPRKQLLNNLSAGLQLPREKTELWLTQNNIKPTQRAETLSIQDWINLTKSLK